MKTAGATQEQIDSFIDNLEPEEFLLLESNKNAFFWFLDVDDLFVICNETFMGLDVKAIQADAQLSGREMDPADYKKLRHIGRVAARELNRG